MINEPLPKRISLLHVKVYYCSIVIQYNKARILSILLTTEYTCSHFLELHPQFPPEILRAEFALMNEQYV